MDSKKYVKDYVRVNSAPQEGPSGEGKRSQVERKKLLSGVAAMGGYPTGSLHLVRRGRAPAASVKVTIRPPHRHTQICI